MRPCGRRPLKSGVPYALCTILALTCLSLCQPPASAGGGPTSVDRGGHFKVVFYGPENSTAAHLISLVLEEAYRKVGSDFLYWPEERLGAVLYPRKKFFDITRSPSWVGAIFDGRIKMPAGGVTERTKELERVIFHEYTHAVVYRLSLGRAPTWLNEGLAEYEEGVVRPGFRERVRALVKEDGMPLRSLEGDFLSMAPERAAKAYDLSLSVTNYIVDEFGFSSARKILTSLARGSDIDAALKGAIYLSYDELERSWKAWVTR